MMPHFITGDQLSEQCGHCIAATTLSAMRQAPSQAERLGILTDALLDVYSSSSGQEAALLGFSVGLLNTVERGLGVHP
jgi:hypothetical protein